MANPVPKRPRDEHDAYYTPDWPIRRFALAVCAELELLLQDPDAQILEPCAGDGAILKVLADVVRGASLDRCVANDLRLSAVARLDALGVGEVFHGDALRLELVAPDRIRIAITNSLWNGNFPLQLARRLMGQSTPPAFFAMLGRLSLLETPKRAAFFKQFPPHVYVLPERVSHTGDGKSDSVGEAWFVFRPGQTDSRLFWLTDDHVQPKLQLLDGP